MSDLGPDHLEPLAPDCPYCGKRSVVASGAKVYPNRGDLSEKWFFACWACRAWVGTHERSGKPLGRLANAELRAAKQRAHAAFDPLWKGKMRRDKVSQKVARGAGYKWLADQMRIAREDCHIGEFTVEQCEQVVKLVDIIRKGRPS